MILRERISNNATRCQLNKQSLDISAINHIVLGKFTIVNFAFILPPLPPQQTRSVFTSKIRKAGHIRKRVYSSKLDFTIVKKAQVWPQPITRAILPQNQSPSVSHSQRGRRLWTDFWQLDDIFEPPGRNELIVWKTDSRFFFLSPHTSYGRGCVRLARFARARLLRHTLPIFFLILRKKTDCFEVYVKSGSGHALYWCSKVVSREFTCNKCNIILDYERDQDGHVTSCTVVDSNSFS